MKERIIVLISVLALSISLVACGGSEPISSNNSDEGKTEESEQEMKESEAENRELEMQPENKMTENVHEIFDMLNELNYQPYTCDGLPEYRLTAVDGTVYAINFSDKWVWRGNSEQAELSDELIAQLKEDSRLVVNNLLTVQTEDNTKDNAVQSGEIDTDNPPVHWGTPDGPETAVENYYANTVFELVSYEIAEASEEHVIFTITSKKGGILVEPNRTIELSYEDGKWQVINEGY